MGKSTVLLIATVLTEQCIHLLKI